jgi:hypothetical protein
VPDTELSAAKAGKDDSNNTMAKSFMARIPL